MRWTIFLGYLAALAVSRPAPQDIDFDLVDATPDPTIANLTDVNAAAIVAAITADIAANLTLNLNLTRRALSARDDNVPVTVITSPGYTAPNPIGQAAINAPLDCNGVDTYMGAKLYTTPFSTAFCAAACSAQSVYNVAHPPASGNPRTCQFFNTYELYKDGVYQGQYCSMYTETWNTTYATNTGQTRGSDVYTIANSYISSNVTNSGLPSPLCPGTVVPPTPPSPPPNPFILQIDPSSGYSYAGQYIQVNDYYATTTSSVGSATQFFLDSNTFLSFKDPNDAGAIKYASGYVFTGPSPVTYFFFFTASQIAGASPVQPFTCSFSSEPPYTLSCSQDGRTITESYANQFRLFLGSALSYGMNTVKWNVLAV